MPPDDSPRAGLPGALKAIAALAVLAIATLAGLLVLDVIPRDAFGDTAGKLLLLLGLGAAVAVALWALSSRGSDKESS
jgi:hypothetical protein